jgi:hypothetical protein
MVNLHKMVVKHSGKTALQRAPAQNGRISPKPLYIMNQGETPAQQLGDGAQPKADMGSRVCIHITL